MFFRVDRYCCGFRAPGDVVEARSENDHHLVDVGDKVSCGSDPHAFWYLVLEYFHFIFCVFTYQDGDPFSTTSIEWYIRSMVG